MNDVELCYLTATEALKLFKAKKLSPVELMSAVIARAEKIQEKLQALHLHPFRGRRWTSPGRPRRSMRRGARTGALEGLPIGIKDESFIKGKPTSFGSLITKDFVPDTTSPNNARIMRAGGIVHARTATPEFSCATYTQHPALGRHPQPVEPEIHHRRLVRRLGRHAGGAAPRCWPWARISAARSGSRPRPRRGRLQAALWPQS